MGLALPVQLELSSYSRDQERLVVQSEMAERSLQQLELRRARRVR